MSVSTLSRNTKPDRSTAALPRSNSSTQSPGTPPLDSISLITTGGTTKPQSLAAPLVALAVVVKPPVPLGQRP